MLAICFPVKYTLTSMTTSAPASIEFTVMKTITWRSTTPCYQQCALFQGQMQNTVCCLVNNQSVTSNSAPSLPTPNILPVCPTHNTILFNLFKFDHDNIPKCIHILGFLTVWITGPDSPNISLMDCTNPVKTKHRWQQEIYYSSGYFEWFYQYLDYIASMAQGYWWNRW